MIDTADIDVSSPRILTRDGNRPGNRLRRDRPTIKIRSQALKDNPALRQHNERHEKSVGELLMEKFFIKDKKRNGGDDGQQSRLYHQVNLDDDSRDTCSRDKCNESNVLQKGITRRFTRRRSSADLQLDPEQLQREATYAQVQAKVLDSLVAEEQAQFENEVRRGTLIKKGTKHSMTNGERAYDANDSATSLIDSDTPTREEGQEREATRIRRTMKKTKRKRKPDKDDALDNGRSSTSSQVSTDSSKIEECREEEEEKGDNEEITDSKPQMYKIEACNSAGDFSTIWMNANSEKEKSGSMQAEQFRESVKIPISRKCPLDHETTPCPKRTEETEARIVLPARRPYVKDSSRNSVYLTMRKPTGKLDVAEDQPSEARDFADFARNSDISRTVDNTDSGKNHSVTSEDKDSVELKNGERKSGIADLTLNEAREIESSRGKRDATIVSKAKSSDVPRVGNAVAVDPPSPKNAASGTAMNSCCSIRPNVSEFVSTREDKAVPYADIVAKTVQKRANRKDDDATGENDAKKYPKAVSTTRNKIVEEKDLHVEPEAVTSRRTWRKDPENATRQNLADSSIGAGGNVVENSACSATLSSRSVTGRLPKPSKINADRNNAVQAPELSLRGTEAEYLANSPKSVEDVVVVVRSATLPGKKANEAWNLAKLPSADTLKKANGVDASKPTVDVLDAIRHDRGAAKSQSEETTTLLKETTGKVQCSNDRKEKAKLSTDDKPTKPSYALTKVARDERIGQMMENVSDKEAKSMAVEAKSSKDRDADIRELVSDADAKKDSRCCFGPVSKTTKLGQSSQAIESILPKVKTTLPKPSVGAVKSTGADRSSNPHTLILPSNALDIPPKTRERKTATIPDKVTGNQLVTVEPTNCNETQREESGGGGGGDQLSKSASTESIDFWSEIKAPGSPEATRSKQRSEIFSRDPAANPKWTSSDSRATVVNGGSSTVLVKEYDDKKNETVVKISSAALDTSAVASHEAETKLQARVTSELGRNDIEKPAVRKQGLPKKKKNSLSITIAGGKDPNRTVKKAPLKRDDSADSTQSNADASPVTWDAFTPTPAVTVPLINITKVPKLSEELEESRNPSDEEHEDPSTPTNEPSLEPSLTKNIAKWSNRHDLTNVDDVETPIASEETSLAASPTVSPESSKTKRAIKKKKPSTTRKATNGEKEIKGSSTRDVESSKTSSVKTTIVEKQLLPKLKTLSPKISPRSSPKNSPSQRPLDLIRMFYTTPSALLTATPRDLSKVKRAKIKRRRHHSRTPSVSSDSTGSTTSTATAESTDGSGSTCTELDDDPEHKRTNSTRSNDSGFDGSPRISSTLFALIRALSVYLPICACHQFVQIFSKHEARFPIPSLTDLTFLS